MAAGIMRGDILLSFVRVLRQNGFNVTGIDCRTKAGSSMQMVANAMEPREYARFCSGMRAEDQSVHYDFGDELKAIIAIKTGMSAYKAAGY